MEDGGRERGKEERSMEGVKKRMEREIKKYGREKRKEAMRRLIKKKMVRQGAVRSVVKKPGRREEDMERKQMGGGEERVRERVKWE